jgi:hypothetical protein
VTNNTKLKLRTPCCDRAVAGVPLMESATELVRRTCPACGDRYQLRITPIWRGVSACAHEATWTRILLADRQEVQS